MKCVEFKDTFFHKLQNITNKLCENTKDTDQNTTSEESTVLTTTEIEAPTVLEHHVNDLSPDNSVTFAKTLANHEKTSTPKPNVCRDKLSTPKDRIKEHSQSLNSKLESVNTTLYVIDSSLKTFTDLISEVKSTVDKILPVLNKQDLLASNQNLNQIKDQIKSFESKITHCNQVIDSLHTKMNI